MNRTTDILHYSVFALILLVMAAMTAIQMPGIQTWITDKAITALEGKTDADINMKSVHFKSFNTLLLKDLTVIDKQPYAEDARDTLLQARSLAVRFSLNSLVGPTHEDVILKEVAIHGGQFNLVIEPTEYHINLTRMFRLEPKQEPEPMPEKDILQIRKIVLEDFTYTMRNYVAPLPHINEHAINWSDMGVDHINLQARNFKISHGLFYGEVDHMDFCERTGWRVKELRAETVSGKGKAIINNIHIEDDESCADLDYSMTGTSKQFGDYVNQVVMEATIRKGRWSLKTLSHFIPPLNPDPKTILTIEGHAKGTVADVTADNLRIKAEGKQLSAILNGSVKGLPDVGNMLIDASLSNTVLSSDAVCRTVNAIAPKAGLNLGRIGEDAVYYGTIKAKGYLDDLSSSINLNEGVYGGTAKIDANVTNILDKTAPMRVSGAIATENFNLGRLLGQGKFGEVSASAKVTATVPRNGVELSAEADSLDVSALRFNGYRYSNIKGNASIQGQDLTVDIEAKDKALDADITVWSDKYAYSGAILIRKADLNAMNFDRRGRSDIAANVYARLDKDLKNIQGNADISGIILANDDGIHRVGDITLNVEKDKGEYDVILDSKAAKGTFKGNKNHMTADFQALDAASLLAYVMPGLYVEQGTAASFQKDTTGYMTGTVSSGRLAYNDNYVKDLKASIEGTLDDMSGTMTSSQIYAGRVELDSNAVTAYKKDSLIHVNYNFNNTDQAAQRKFGGSDISADITLHGKKNFDINILPSRLNADGKDWAITPSSIRVNGNNIDIDHFSLENDDHWLRVNGNISEEEETVLTAEIQEFNLDILNEFFRKNVGVHGIVNADAKVYSPVRDGGVKGIETVLDGRDLALGGQSFGHLEVKSSFDDSQKLFDIGATENIDGRNVMKGSAVYKPADKYLSADVDMSGFPLGFVQYLMPDVFSDTKGTLSGKLSAEGPVNDLTFSSRDGHLNDGLLQIAFTHVPYMVEGGFRLDNNGIFLDKASVKDRHNGTGTITGGMKWNRLKDMALDIHMDVKNMEAINIPKNERGFMNGNVFATGKVNLTGPLNNVLLDADAKTVGKSILYLTISGTADASKGNLLTFKDPFAKSEDPYRQILLKYNKQLQESESNFNMHFHFLATPELAMFLNLGNSGFAAGMNGTGNGDITLDITSNPDNFSILGDYTLAEGYFNVNASNIVSRSFTIAEGSTIKFGGDIMSSIVNLNAVYQTKASIETLLSDKDAVSNRRQVNCGIHIQDKLSKPNIDFSIDIPDLSPAARSQVESALSTEDKIQKQFLSLLLSNNFLPDEQSGIVNNNSLLYSNVSEMMANQVNNIFNKLNIPLDLGLNYRPAENGSSSLFDVALSTQLFNNRVIIGGTLGNKQNMSTNQESLFGNLDIQYKVIKSGSLRLNLFSHAADQYTNALDDSQKNGLGVTWQQEFDRWPDWIKKLFSSKVQKEVITALEAEEARKTKTITLDGE